MWANRKNVCFLENEKSATCCNCLGCGCLWWMIRGSNTVDIFKQISEIVEKKGADIVYRVMSGQMYPEVYPRFSEINALQ